MDNGCYSALNIYTSIYSQTFECFEICFRLDHIRDFLRLCSSSLCTDAEVECKQNGKDIFN